MRQPISTRVSEVLTYRLKAVHSIETLLSPEGEVMEKIKSLKLMVEMLKDGRIPSEVVSPSYAAAALGISRSALSQRLMWAKSLRAWKADGVILIDEKSLKEAVREKRNISKDQGELYGT